MTILTTNAIEKSTFVITASFTDEDGNAVTPNELTWTLSDSDGTVINSRQDVSLTPATSVDILLQGDDLVVSGNRDDRRRIVLIEGTYNSAAGSDLPIRDEVKFQIVDLINI